MFLNCCNARLPSMIQLWYLLYNILYIMFVHHHLALKLFEVKLWLVQNQPLTSSTQHTTLLKQLWGLLGHSCIDFNILLLTFKAPLCLVDSRNIQTLWYASSASLLLSSPPTWLSTTGLKFSSLSSAPRLWNSSRHLDVNISAHL